MAIDLTRPAPDLFLTPGRDPGLSFLSPIARGWRDVPLTRVAGHAVSTDPGHQAEIVRHLRLHDRYRRFARGVEFDVVPVVLEDALFEHSYASARGRWLLNGAAGTRLRNRHARANPDGTAEAALIEAMAQRDAAPVPPIWAGEVTDLPIAIEARNLFNYFHFATETLPQLTTFADPRFTGPIHIHSPTETPAGFVAGFIRALFPELADRVRYLRAPARYERCLTSFSLRHWYPQAPDDVMPPMDAFVRPSWLWHGRRAHRGSLALIAMNGFDAGLRRLRERALERAADVADDLPRRVWVARDAEGPRGRRLKGEGRLRRALAPLGFEAVRFEALEPLSQVALMARAEAMASHHGTGFANMAYAHPRARVVEVGTAQTAVHRWHDFMPHAHVAGCHYDAFFADYNAPDPARVPDIDRDGLLPVAISEAGVAAVAAHFEVALAGPRPTGWEAVLLARGGPLNAAADWPALEAMLAADAPLISGHPDLLVMAANCARARGNLREAYDRLTAAWALAPDRPRLLERRALLARRTGRGPLADALLAEHRACFPNAGPALPGGG